MKTTHVHNTTIEVHCQKKKIQILFFCKISKNIFWDSYAQEDKFLEICHVVQMHNEHESCCFCSSFLDGFGC